MRPGLFAAINIFLIICSIKLPAQEAGSYTVFRYTSKNGLPQNSIKSLVMDNSRYLWVTTEGGIVRFDGSNFKTYTHVNTPGITNDRFRNIIKTTDGRFVTDDAAGNVFEIKDGRIIQLRKNDADSTTGSIIYGGVHDIEFFLGMYDNKFPFNLMNDQFGFFYIFPLPGNKHAIKSTNGIKLFEDQKLIKEIDLTNQLGWEFFLLNNHIYFFDTQRNIFRVSFDDDKVIPVELTGEIRSPQLNKFIPAKNVIWNYANPDVYLRLGNKLIELLSDENPDKIKTKQVINNLPENCFVLNAFYDSKSNNIFIGTDSKGLYIYKKKFFTVTLLPDSINKFGNSYYSLCEVDSHHVYAGFDREFSVNGYRKSTYNLGNPTTECIIRDRKDNVYFAKNTGLFKFESSTGIMRQISASDRNEYHCFYEDGDSILTGSLFGIGYIKNDNHYILSQLPKNKFNYRIEDIIRGPDGKIWIANCSGVSRFNESSGTFDTVPGLQGICSRAFYRNGSLLLIGTYSDGYLAWENGKVTKFPLDKNRYLSHVHSFSIDNNSNMWMSTNKGLLRTSFTNIRNYIKNPVERISYYYYGEDDGILNTEFNGGCSPPMVKLKNGYSVYPTLEGLVWFKPEALPEIIPDEVILIDEVRVNGKSLPRDEKIVIPSDHENIEFRFSTPFWGNNASLDLDYQLEGFNKSPIIIPASGNIVTFSKLPSGTYTFRIRKLNHSDDNDIIEVSIPVIVEKTFYETLPFILSSIISLILIVIVIIKLNTRRIIQKNIQLESKIAERTNELKSTNVVLQENIQKLAEQEVFLKDSIKVKDKLVSVISHDIITPLKFISMVSRISKKNKDDIENSKLLESLGDIEFAADKLFNNATNILNWMKLQNNRIVPQISHIAIHDLVEECIEPLKGMAEIRKIKLENKISEEEIIQSDRHILSIIIQNIVSNAIKYTEQGTVVISGEINNDKYAIHVSDTGLGFGKSVLEHINNTLAGVNKPDKQNETWYLENGLGYSIIADLLPHIQGQITINSNPGTGSVVTLIIPFK